MDSCSFQWILNSSLVDGTARICAANVGKSQIVCGGFKDGLRGAAEEAQGVSAFAPMTNLVNTRQICCNHLEAEGFR